MRYAVLSALLRLLLVLVPVGAMAGTVLGQCDNQAYITNTADDTISVIDTLTRTVIETIPAGSSPSSVAVHPDGRTVYVINNDSTVSVVDTFTNAIVDTIAVSRLRGAVVTPDGSELWGSNINDDTVSVIDTETLLVTDVIPAGTTPNLVAISPDGSTVYVTNQGGGVTVIDAATKTVTTTVPMGGIPSGITVSPDGSEVWVARFTADLVSVIDTSTNTIVSSVNPGTQPFSIAFHPDGSTAYVANLGSDDVAVVDAVTKSVVNTIATSAVDPFGIDIHPDGLAVYVTVTGNDSVDVIDTASETIVETIAVGGSPQSLGRFIAPVSVPAPEQVVYLDFGQIGVAVEKDDRELLNADLSTLGTLEKGAREGFDPEDLGFAPGTNRDAVIRQIVDQIRTTFTTEDGSPLNICFEGRLPNRLQFTTIAVIDGAAPPLDISSVEPDPDGEVFYIAEGNEFTVDAGAGAGFSVQIADGQMRRPDGSIVGGVLFPELQVVELDVLGAAQTLDLGNTDEQGKAWVFVGEHTGFGSPEANVRELANSICHELGHLLGLQHEDGLFGSLMGPSGVNPGTVKLFSTASRRKLVEALSPVSETFPFAGAGFRVREARVGDTDQHGVSEIGPLTGDPDTDAASVLRQARRLLQANADYAREPFQFPLSDLTQSSPSDGLFTDIALANGTTASYVLDLGEAGLMGTYVGARLELGLLNVADVLGGPDDFQVFIDGFELPGALDGLDQRLTAPEFAGYGEARTVTLYLDDFLSLSQINTILTDGILNVDLEVGGATSEVSVDTIAAIVTDNGPLAIAECGIGAVNLGGGERVDLLFVNGTAGGELRTVPVAGSEQIWTAMLLPPGGGNGKFLVHLNVGEPSSAGVTQLPGQIGTFCFPLLLPSGATPSAIWNNIGKESQIGSSEYFGAPISDPERAPVVFLQLDNGDTMNLPVGTKATLQGAIVDPKAVGARGVSTTNAVVLSIE